jgi:hypothetical protein
VSETLEHTARRIAERGRDTLVARLRPAFAKAAAAHSDVLELDSEELERMVQSAADRADGLQWRRALATVATEELGISLGEALGHPAVARAQAIVGAPSYEESLAAIGRSPEAASAGTEPEPDLVQPPADGEATPAEAPTEAVDAHDDEAFTAIHLPAVHLDGVPELARNESELELRFSERGLEVLRDSDEATLARIPWEDLRGLNIEPPKGRLRRRRPGGARLVVHIDYGDAAFEIPGIEPDELRRRLTPARVRI